LSLSSAIAQEPEPIKDTIATTIEEALRSPLDFKVLDLRKQKLKELPDKFDRLVNLHTIYLGKNKLKDLPSSLSHCTKLRHLDISNNKFESLPTVVCQLRQLRLLDISTNIIIDLPECLIQDIHLESILMVGNEISIIPDSFTSLDLKEIDMRMIQMNEREQNAIRDLFPNAEIRFSKPCNCFEDDETENDF
jgi:Leucine-rich repeat (LRR) protein